MKRSRRLAFGLQGRKAPDFDIIDWLLAIDLDLSRSGGKWMVIETLVAKGATDIRKAGSQIAP